MTFRLIQDAIELNRLVRPIVEAVEKHDRGLAKQLRGAVQSVAANLAEGRARRGGHQRQQFGVAFGSANETKAHLRVAAIWVELDEDAVERAIDLADKVAACTYRCLHPRRRA